MTAFTSHHGLYRFTQMPFGLMKALNTFQWTMHVALLAAKLQFPAVYFDNIFVFSRSSAEQIHRVNHVWTLLRDARITLQLKKCSLFSKTIDCMGHVIRPRRLYIALHTTGAIKGLKTSRNVTELKWFLGLCNVFRRFVPTFGRIVSPHNDKWRKDQQINFELNEKVLEVMKSLQKKFILPPVLTLPYAEGQINDTGQRCLHRSSRMCNISETTW